MPSEGVHPITRPGHSLWQRHQRPADENPDHPPWTLCGMSKRAQRVAARKIAKGGGARGGVVGIRW
jgi:hypothetical protein